MELNISTECFLCNKQFGWSEIIITKLPENITFCENCASRFDDKKVYTKDECWAVNQFNPGIRFIG